MKTICKDSEIVNKYSRFDVISFFILFLVIALFCAAQIYQVEKRHGRELRGVSTYAYLANNIVETGKYTLNNRPYLTRMPVYPYLVAFTKLVAGHNWSYLLIVIQGALGLLCGILLNRITYRLTLSQWIPGLATLTYAFHTALQWEHLALRETGVYELLILCFFYFAAQKAISPKTITFMVIMCIASYYTRATGVFLIVALGLFIWFIPHINLARRLSTVGLAVGAVILAAVPWQVYQSHAQGKLVLAATDVGGLNLYKGNSFAFEEISPYIDHDAGGVFIPQLVQPSASSGIKHDTDNTITDDYLEKLAQADIHSDLLRFLRKACLKVTTYLSPIITPLGRADVQIKDNKLALDNYRGNFVRAYGNWIAFAQQMSFFVVLFIIPLGLLGMIRHAVSAGPLRPLAIASLGFLLVNIAAHAAITAETRYRLYLDPLFLVWAWLAVSYIFSHRQNHLSAKGMSDYLID